jgi:hypothetical protein
MNDYALRFEYLMRRAFQCGRYGVPGANADIFRALESNFVRFRDNTNADSHDECLRKYASYCGSVSTYIETAIEKFAKDYDKKLTAKQNQEVEDLLTLLYDDATIETIEQVIDRTEDLMLQHGVYPQ